MREDVELLLFLLRRINFKRAAIKDFKIGHNAMLLKLNNVGDEFTIQVILMSFTDVTRFRVEISTPTIESTIKYLSYNDIAPAFQFLCPNLFSLYFVQEENKMLKEHLALLRAEIAKAEVEIARMKAIDAKYP